MSIILNILTFCSGFWWPEALRPTSCILFQTSCSALWQQLWKAGGPSPEEGVTHHEGHGANASAGSVHGGHGAPAIGVDVVALHVTETRVVIQAPDGVNGPTQGHQRDASPREPQQQHLSASP